MVAGNYHLDTTPMRSADAGPSCLVGLQLKAPNPNISAYSTVCANLPCPMGCLMLAWCGVLDARTRRTGT
jgi:hypothetical protein